MAVTIWYAVVKTLTCETYFVTVNPYPVTTMLPSFMNKRRSHRRPNDDQNASQRVRLVECPRQMVNLLGQIGTVEGTDGEEVLVRFGEIVVQVPPEWVEAVEE